MAPEPRSEPIGLELRVIDDDPKEILRLTEWFCAHLFPDLPEGFIPARLRRFVDPLLCLAQRHGEPVGFKLGHRVSDDVLNSFIGGVLPEARRLGVASDLTRLQHEVARTAGYTHVETRSRPSNTAMIILNLRHGFEIVGLETNPYGDPVVIQRARIARAD